jgi:hypothetical protein
LTEVITLKLPYREFSSRNTPFSNLLTTQPIHRHSNSIDAAQQSKYDTKLEKGPNFNPGEQFSRKFTPKGISQ